jgi:hypothetical protein
VATPTGDAAGYSLAFDEGKASIASQEATLREARDRISTVVSAAAVAIGLASTLAFGGGRAQRFSEWGVTAGVVAALAFASIVLVAVILWRPFEGIFTLDAGAIVGSYVEGTPPAGLPEIHRELALHLARHVLSNRDRLSTRLSWFTWALWAFAVEVAALMIMLLDIAR